MKLYSFIHISIFFLVVLSINNNHHHPTVVNAAEDAAEELVSDLLTDENFKQCFLDKTKLVLDNPELRVAEGSFLGTVKFSQVIFTNDMASISMVYFQDKKEEYRNACEAAGGNFDEMDGSIICKGEYDLTTSIQNFGECLPITDACGAIGIWDIMEEIMEFSGFECDASTVIINTVATENAIDTGTTFDPFENGTESTTGSGTASGPLPPLPPPVPVPNPSTGSDNSSSGSSSSSGAVIAAVEATKAESNSGAALASTSSLVGTACLGFFMF